MLTKAYYFNFYRPYIVGSRDRNDVTAKRARIAKTTPKDKLDRGMMVVLNKSLKNEIVRYAQNVSAGVTGFKSSLHMLLSDMGNFGLNAMYNGYDSAAMLVEDSLTAVAKTYNSSTTFLEEQNQSVQLRSYSQSLRERLMQGGDRLKSLGLTFENEGRNLQFNPEVFRSLSQIELHAVIGANMQIFHSMHQNTATVLTEPLSSHMHFKGLSYHYNYQLGRMVEDGFGIIESGMIVDRVV